LDKDTDLSQFSLASFGYLLLTKDIRDNVVYFNDIVAKIIDIVDNIPDIVGNNFLKQ